VNVRELPISDGAGSDVKDGQQIPNAGRRTLNIELRKEGSALGVGRWAFSEILTPLFRREVQHPCEKC
jgi:hypothetical protein